MQSNKLFHHVVFVFSVQEANDMARKAGLEKEAQDAIDKGAAEREIARQRERQREIERAKQILAENEEGK